MIITRIARRLGNERGMVLVLALGVLISVSVTSVAIIEYTSSNTRSTNTGKSDQLAFALGEAGINNAMAVLSHPENNALNPDILPERTNEYEGGSVTWSGVLDQLNAVWTLTSVGRVDSPHGVGDLTRTLTAKVPVTPTLTQPLDNPAWNYIFSYQVTGGDCDMTLKNTVEVGARLYVSGNLCLQNKAWISGGQTLVGGEVTMSHTDNTIGTSAAPISELHVGAGCKWSNNARHDPCLNGAGSSGYDNVWATTITNTPPALTAPVADWDAWYLNASPGPFYPCYTVSGTPPTFDNDQNTASPSASTRNNSVAGTFHLTPAASYTCWTAGGELSWNATTKVLTVRGTIFIDGNVKVENGALNTYDGQATMYVSGSVLLKNSKLCGGVSGSDCDFAAWDPNQRMLVFVANGSGGQTDVPTGVSIEIKSAQFQGGLYGTNKVQFDTSSKSDGPVVASEVVLGQSIVMHDFPVITEVPAGMPSNPTIYAQPNSPELFSG
ncbi:MAG TPA: hypothetical protein VM198_10060 [Longimicrobiales bacterium]|nr:hypothetical protein [Longimicrobiales bacterium]